MPHSQKERKKKKKASSWYRDLQLESLAKWDLNTVELTSTLLAASKGSTRILVSPNPSLGLSLLYSPAEESLDVE